MNPEEMMKKARAAVFIKNKIRIRLDNLRCPQIRPYPYSALTV